jgi:hypothetical protein
MKQGAGADSILIHRPPWQRNRLQNWQASVQPEEQVIPSLPQVPFSTAEAQPVLPPWPAFPP